MVLQCLTLIFFIEGLTLLINSLSKLSRFEFKLVDHPCPVLVLVEALRLEDHEVLSVF